MKRTYHHLYAILGILTPYAVGWMIAGRESATRAERLLADAVARQRVDRGQLAIHLRAVSAVSQGGLSDLSGKLVVVSISDCRERTPCR
ncbi:hypothetical protein [Plantactinospora sp. KLBMP9567]|uniref:hypothetical protein n=1 Tax=Plantactinospora sp. KLBMP9567 TaxID=3085900 RepID=UPI0029827276|nr:hypothetical protein [Plantactinospora sp. KLBMP9567]MDW5329580.1 hypothetical protein [Plantactinospora sp. KLBMP9567]